MSNKPFLLRKVSPIFQENTREYNSHSEGFLWVFTPENSNVLLMAWHRRVHRIVYEKTVLYRIIHNTNMFVAAVCCFLTMTTISAKEYQVSVKNISPSPHPDALLLISSQEFNRSNFN